MRSRHFSVEELPLSSPFQSEQSNMATIYRTNQIERRHSVERKSTERNTDIYMKESNYKPDFVISIK